MLFLIEYDRMQGSVASMRAFADTDWDVAEDARLQLELSLNQSGLQREVVVLEAPDEQALRITHRRYFVDLAGLARSSAAGS